MIVRRLYALLIRLHPRQFRDKCGDEMQWIFDQPAGRGRRAAYLLDVAVSLLRQWLLRPLQPAPHRVTPQKYQVLLCLSYCAGEVVLWSMPANTSPAVQLMVCGSVLVAAIMLFRYARRRLMVNALRAPLSLMHLDRRSQLEDTLRDLRAVPWAMISLLSFSATRFTNVSASLPDLTFTLVWLALALKLNGALIRTAEDEKRNAQSG